MQKKHLLLFCFILIIYTKGWSQEENTVSFGTDTLGTFIPDTSLRTKLVKVAKEYIGVRYRRGQSNANGFDCSGYVKYIFRKFNFSLPHSSSAQYKQCRRVKFNEAQPGDLVFFVIHGKHISHVGIYLGNNMFIHSPSYGKRVSIESLDGAYYKRHLLGFGSVL